MAQRNHEAPPADRTVGEGLGAAIRQARESLGMSQARLAERVGFPAFQTVSDIELGRRRVEAFELVRIARTLHTSIDVLLGLSTEPRQVRVLWRRGARADHREREAQLRERARRYAELEAWCDESSPVPPSRFPILRPAYGHLE